MPLPGNVGQISLGVQLEPLSVAASVAPEIMFGICYIYKKYSVLQLSIHSAE